MAVGSSMTSALTPREWVFPTAGQQFLCSVLLYSGWLPCGANWVVKNLFSNDLNLTQTLLRRRSNCDALTFGRLWYHTPDNAVPYAQFYSRSHDAVIRIYDDAGNVIETHEHKGDFKEW